MPRPPDEAKGIEEKRAMKQAETDRKRARAKAMWEAACMSQRAMCSILHVDTKTLRRWATKGGWKDRPSRDRADVVPAEAAGTAHLRAFSGSSGRHKR